MSANAAGWFRQAQGRPAGALLSGPALASLLLLVVNDHVVKAAWPGTVSGKLSDLAGLVLLPIVLIASWELLRGRVAPTAVAWTMSGLTAAFFVALQLSPAFGGVYAMALGVAQGLVGLQQGPVAPVAHTADPTDLLALVVIPLALALQGHRQRLDG